MSRPKGHGVLAWALLAPHVALAEAPPPPESAPLALRWNDEEGLAPTTQEDFERRLSERLGRTAFEPTVRERALSVTWLGNRDNCRVQLHLVLGARVEGTRLLDSPGGGCATVLPALLTVSALLIESESAQAAAEPPPSAPPPSAPPPSAPPPPASAPPESLANPAVAEPTRPRPRLMLSFGGSLLSGLVPRSELGPSAQVLALPTGATRVGVGISGYLSREYGESPGLSLAHQSAALVSCFMPLTASVSLGVCASATLHRFRSQGLSLVHSERQHSYTWTAGLAGRGEWQLTQHFWWTAAAGPELSPSPLYFYYRQADAQESKLFTQRRVSLSLWTGLTVGLP